MASPTALWVAPAPLLTTIQHSLDINIGKAGSLVTLIPLVAGIFMFTGSLLIDRLSLKAAAIISMSILALGSGLSYFVTSYTDLFVTRTIVGIGVGLALPLAGALTMTWFPAREQPYINSLNSVFALVGMALVFLVAARLQSVVGRWQNVLAILGILPFFTALCWRVIGRTHPQAGPTNEMAKTVHSGRESGLAMAARRPEVWLLTIALTCQMWVFNTFTTFLPTFLETVRGVSQAHAGSLTSLVPLTGLAGTLICGVGTGILGRRKPFLWPPMAMELCAALAIMNFPIGPPLYVAIAIFGFGASSLNPPLMTVVMDLKNSSPALTGGAVALIFGVSFCTSFFVSPIFGKLAQTWGVSMTMTAFSLPLLVSVAALSIIRETGPAVGKSASIG